MHPRLLFNDNHCGLELVWLKDRKIGLRLLFAEWSTPRLRIDGSSREFTSASFTIKNATGRKGPDKKVRIDAASKIALNDKHIPDSDLNASLAHPVNHTFYHFFVFFLFFFATFDTLEK